MSVLDENRGPRTRRRRLSERKKTPESPLKLPQLSIADLEESEDDNDEHRKWF
jgi:hypothetical protein